MFSQLSFYIFSILILHIFTSRRVYGVTCDYYEKTCGTYPNTWCCPDYKYCGYSYNDCPFYTTTRSPEQDTPMSVILSIFIVSIFSCFIWVCCCIWIRRRQQRLSSHRYNTNVQTVTCPYQQQPIYGPSRVPYVRPVYNVNVAPPIHSMCEAPPPSYEAATANLSSPYPSAPPLPVTATI